MNKNTAKALLSPKRNRVRINSSFVDAATAEQLAAWNKQNVSIGVILDRLTAFAKTQNFNPTKPTIN